MIRWLLVISLLIAGGSVFADAANGTPGIGKKTINVIVINFDPILKRNSLTLRETMKWSDPHVLTQNMIDDIRRVSQGYVNYKVVETIEYDGYTQFRDGFVYSEDQFMDVLTHDHDKANSGMTSFKWLFAKFDLEKKIKDKNISEIWLWGAPYMSWDELHWKTPGDKIPYQTDNPWFYRPYDIPDVGRTIWIMGWNYERGEGEMLESYGHRIESVMSLTVGKGYGIASVHLITCGIGSRASMWISRRGGGRECTFRAQLQGRLRLGE